MVACKVLCVFTVLLSLVQNGYCTEDNETTVEMTMPIGIEEGVPGMVVEEETTDRFHVSTSLRARNLHLRDPTNERNFRRYGGYVSYGLFYGPKQLNYGAAAIITPLTYSRRIGSGTDRRIEPSGWSQIGVTGNNRHRCHVIGDQLGGSGKDARNLFTCHAFANTPVMRYYEDRIAQWIRTPDPFGRQKSVRYIVWLVYLFRRGPTGNAVGFPNSPIRDYPEAIRIRSEEVYNGAVSGVLQDVQVYNKNRAGTYVEFICQGRMPQSTPPSVVRVRLAPALC